MRKFIMVVVVSIVALGAFGQAVQPPTTRSTLVLSEKIATTIEMLALENNAYTNSKKSNAEAIATLRAATPASLHKPTLVASKYSSVADEDGTKNVIIRWVEAQPTLKDVIIANPDTGKEFRASIQESDLKTQADWGNVLYVTSVKLPIEIARDETQVLEVLTLDRAQRVALYPSGRRKD